MEHHILHDDVIAIQSDGVLFSEMRDRPALLAAAAVEAPKTVKPRRRRPLLRRRFVGGVEGDAREFACYETGVEAAKAMLAEFLGVEPSAVRVSPQDLADVPVTIVYGPRMR